MKLALSCLLFVGSILSTYGQCDENLTATPGSYLVTMDPDKTDAIEAPYIINNCLYLEQIESVRKDDKDATLKVGNYIIEVYSRNRVINLESTEQ